MKEGVLTMNDRRIGDETAELECWCNGALEELAQFDSFNMDDFEKAMTDNRISRGNHPNSRANLKKGRRFRTDDLATKEASRKGHETQSLFAALQNDDFEAAYRLIERDGNRP